MPVNDSMEQYLGETRAALTAAHHSAIQEHVAAYGLGPDRLAEGMQVWTRASEVYDAYLEAHYAMNDAMRAHVERLEALRRDYVRHRKLLRVAFDADEGARERLRLVGRMPKAQDALLSTARTTYQTLLDAPALQASASAVTVTPDAVRAGLDEVAAVEELGRQRAQAATHAKAATTARNAAVGALRAWMHDFWRLVEVALEPSPQLQEMLGRTVPSR